MSYKRVDTLGDAMRHRLWLEIICLACRRTRRVAPFRLLGGKRGPDMLLSRLGLMMRCRGEDLTGGGCGHRGAIVRPVFSPSSPDDDPPTGGGGATIIPFPIEARGSAPVPDRRRRRA